LIKESATIKESASIKESATIRHRPKRRPMIEPIGSAHG
jgi:hypothetical protein